MDVRIYQKGHVYCDIGPHSDMMRIDFHGAVYMTMEEYAKFTGEFDLIAKESENAKDS